jgi:hypothetical protein
MIPSLMETVPSILLMPVHRLAHPIKGSFVELITSPREERDKTRRERGLG